MGKLTWPAWFSSPDGKSTAVFEKAEDVPNGWHSGAEKQTTDDSAAKTEKKKPVAKTPKKAGRKPKAAAPLDL